MAIERSADFDDLAEDGVRREPGLETGAHAFSQHLCAILEDETPPAAERLGDLYLAFAAGRGDAAAVTRIRERFGADVDQALRKATSTGMSLDDLRQRAWMKLLAGRPPYVHRYLGRGSLQGWIRVVVSRLVIDLLRSHGARKESSVTPTVLAELGRAQLDPQLELLRDRHRDDVQAALEHAFNELSDEDRRLLRGQLLEKLGTDDLGALYGVHRTTAARWVQQARGRLVRFAHEELKRRLGAGEATVNSLVGIVRSQLELSVSRLLASRDD